MKSSQNTDAAAVVQSWNERYPESPILPELVTMGSVARVARYFEQRFSAALEEEGLQKSHIDSLFQLLDSAPRLGSASALAEASGVTNASMTYRLDRMEENGWIRRLPDPTDRRGSLIELTPAGHEVGLKGMAIKCSVASEFLANLPEDLRRGLNLALSNLLGYSV